MLIGLNKDRVVRFFFHLHIIPVRMSLRGFLFTFGVIAILAMIVSASPELMESEEISSENDGILKWLEWGLPTKEILEIYDLFKGANYLSENIL
ncbi:hypothetical protein K7432_003459 [Basidiobolus ranarum]|uniref:Uncharacterized protein n=1 Tax=Basidiobolus ranarum TaxID=34480 RepID=A0ABR2WZS6_9FUNG